MLAFWVMIALVSLTSSVDGQQTIPCDAKYMFRTFDGTCGNLTNPFLGSAGTAYTRMFPASYSDGIFIYQFNNQNKKIYEFIFLMMMFIACTRCRTSS